MLTRLTELEAFKYRSADRKPLTNELIESNISSHDISPEVARSQRHRLLPIKTLDLLCLDQGYLEIQPIAKLFGERANAGKVTIADDASAGLKISLRQRFHWLTDTG